MSDGRAGRLAGVGVRSAVTGTLTVVVVLTVVMAVMTGGVVGSVLRGGDAGRADDEKGDGEGSCNDAADHDRSSFTGGMG